MTSHSSRPFFRLACFFVLGTVFQFLPSGYGQANVSVVSGASSTLFSGATTATFNEINPSSYYGTGGTLLNPTTYYTTPISLANSSTNGTAKFSGTTAATSTAFGTFVSGSSSGQYGAPTGDTTTYASIGGARAGALTLTFSNTNINYFGLDWASPDSYNSVKLTFANGTMATYTPGTNSGGFVLLNGASDAYVNFTSSTPSNAITQVVLSSTSAAFELDNFSYGVVPEPSTWLAGGLTLLVGGISLARRFACVRA